MAKDSFKKYLKGLEEETTSGDISTVDNKLDMQRSKDLLCKEHKRLNCKECRDNKVV